MKVFKVFFSTVSLFPLFLSIAFAGTLELRIESEPPEINKILESAVTLPETLKTAQPTNRRWLRHYQKQLPQVIGEILQPYGYFNSQVESELSRQQDQQLLTIRVTPGLPVRISHLELKVSGPGAQISEIAELAKKFPLQTDDILRQDRYEQGKALLLKNVIDLGFHDADYTVHQVRVFQQENRAEITLHLQTGIRYRFGPTTFQGNSNYPERFLRRYLSYNEGETFSHTKLGRTQLNLVDADLFKTVKVEPDPDHTQGEYVPVNVEIQPAPRQSLRPGLGYGTDTGFRGSLRYRILNLFQRGHDLKGDLLLAEQQQSLITTYNIPDLRRIDSRTQLRIGFDREKNDSYLSRELFAEAEYQRAFNKDFLAGLFLRLTDEYSEIGEDETRAQLLLPGIRLQWHPVDRVPYNLGVKGSLEVKGALADLLSETSLLQLSLQTSSRIPLTNKFSLLLRLKGGTTWHADTLNELPASLRFFAGGDQSVRGYAYQSLGPKDESGQVIGGNHLLVGNFELEKEFTARWGGAIFYDIGNAFDSLTDYELAQGAGIGIRRYTPIGPIHLDIARQIGQSNPRWRVHLSVGVQW
ncbi:MAG: BamA/TamA family outer membrane protein [Desulfuromonadales bacterium]|nr:BamA/TamA family outer membrane protein [Desulfuromonadales bacterium]MBN2792107.1 BamA/TamA family outer membrane protein [Desulfuromonadales bacterium]